MRAKSTLYLEVECSEGVFRRRFCRALNPKSARFSILLQIIQVVFGSLAVKYTRRNKAATLETVFII